MAPNPALLTTGEAAALLGVSVNTLGRWCKDQRIPHITMPSGRYKFRREDIDALLTPATVGTAAAEAV